LASGSDDFRHPIKTILPRRLSALQAIKTIAVSAIPSSAPVARSLLLTGTNILPEEEPSSTPKVKRSRPSPPSLEQPGDHGRKSIAASGSIPLEQVAGFGLELVAGFIGISSGHRQ